MKEDKKSHIVSVICLKTIKELKDNGLDDFEILTSLLLISANRASYLKIGKKILVEVIEKLYDDMDTADRLATFVVDLNIEA